MAIPLRATYRVQLTPSFGFDEAAAIVPYLDRLGVSHLYTSPLEEATSGSQHGYDVTDHHRVRPELGGEPGLRRLWEALDRRGMAQIVDIVPNHMGIRHRSNRWWQDVLGAGPESRYAGHFDIDWDPPDPTMTGRVLLPFLGSSLAEAVEDGLITVERADDGEGLMVQHGDDLWPVSFESMLTLGIDADDDALDEAVEDLTGSGGLLMELLELQHWRAAHWREAATGLNWRRFFDVTDLAAVCVEQPEVFDDVHALLAGWFEDDLGSRVVQGVRVDHVDGLVDPEGYLARLRRLVGPERLLVVEKILAADEVTPSTWAVDGTTGYELVARIDEAITEPAGAASLAVRAASTTGGAVAWPEVELTAKHLVAEQLLQPEVALAARRLGTALDESGDQPIEPGRVREAVVELAAHLGVYRTYPRAGAGELPGVDRARIADALDGALRSRPDLAGGAVERVAELLCGDHPPGSAAAEGAVRFAQLTAPLTAKAVEDTAFYRAVALPWLNEVGGDPGRRTVPLDEVVAALVTIAATGPGTLGPLTTHDTKRSGDVRARMSRLALHPEHYADQVGGWHRAAARHRSPAGPDPAFEWFLWATIVGAWPITVERLQGYATKAMREAKLHTSWLDPDDAYEAAVHDFVAGVLTDEELTGSIARVVAGLLAEGRAASLAQVVLAATAAGAPDLYQGDEVWNLSLVDPDNRRPVDHHHLDRLLTALDDGPALPERWAAAEHDPDDDGSVKLAVWRSLLALRAERPGSFGAPLTALGLDGDAADTVLGLHRGDDVAVVVPVRAGSEPPSGRVRLPPGRWRDVLSGASHDGGAVPVAELLGLLPVAVLARS